MKLAKKLGLVLSGISTALVSTAVITSTYTPAAQAAEIVKNGSFEQDELVDPKNPNVNNPNIIDWTKSMDEDRNEDGIRIDNFPAPEFGNQGLSIGSFLGPAYISQNLDTTIGQNYNLSFYLGTDEDGTDVDNIFQAFVDGNKIFEKINSENAVGVPFTRYESNFSATKSSTELKLGGRARYGFLYLDAISVKPNVSRSVPEPSVLGGTIFAGLLGVWLKRKQLSRKNA